MIEIEDKDRKQGRDRDNQGRWATTAIDVLGVRKADLNNKESQRCRAATIAVVVTGPCGQITVGDLFHLNQDMKYNKTASWSKLVASERKAFTEPAPAQVR